MSIESRKAIHRFIVWIIAAIALLGIYRYAPDGPFSGLAIGGFALISGPIFLLAAVDVGRALRRERLSPVVSAVTRIPEFFLGSLAFATGVGGIALVPRMEDFCYVIPKVHIPQPDLQLSTHQPIQ